MATFNRACGVLMHISSLPGNTGIGTLGKNAYKFVDFLKKAGQSYWQILPICPTSYGDSPYQAFSTFAGNPYFIDLDFLAEEGYLAESDFKKIKWSSENTDVDYGLLYKERHNLFSVLQKNFTKNKPPLYEDFCTENSFWLDDYALFMAVKDAHDGRAFGTWEEGIRKREKSAVEEWTSKCAQRIDYYKMLQFFFFSQWKSLKDYANRNGIKIIGDLPIYVAADSSDVWTSPKQFELDENFVPLEVAGCPPDAFTADGQLWGNPVYDWDYMKNDGYLWWKKRIEVSLKTYDILRIDHFRGFDTFYAIPYGEKTARVGAWKPGPGIDLFESLKKDLGDLPIIAEDLGYTTDSVRKLLKDTGFPGMKVLQFSFGPEEGNENLPSDFISNSVVYTGTHDNDTLKGWLRDASEFEKDNAMKFLGLSDENKIPKAMMEYAISSKPDTCILTMQDLIGLDSSARMNKPSTLGTNWRWRATEDQITDEIASFLYENSKKSDRLH
ncbi:MAG: 4-alpha-glucanotransferase [Treponema sp.]|nr:4-alpha-glucanotransferase [Treponema sp.]